jgi:hypothetical protein
MSIERIIAALVVGAMLAVGGYYVGQYAPFTGGLASIAEPFSPVRNSTANGYAVVAGFIGVVIGLMVSPAKEGKTKNCPACAESVKIEATKCRYCGEELS